MTTELFEASEIVKRYDNGWTETPEWRRLNASDEFTGRLVRRLQEHYAGITILGGNQPIGSEYLYAVRRHTGCLPRNTFADS